MTEAEMQTAVVIIRHGWAHRIPVEAIESCIRRAVPAITLEELAAAFERASDKLVAEADELW
jgi:hypothetical protein